MMNSGSVRFRLTVWYAGVLAGRADQIDEASVRRTARRRCLVNRTCARIRGGSLDPERRDGLPPLVAGDRGGRTAWEWDRIRHREIDDSMVRVLILE